MYVIPEPPFPSSLSDNANGDKEIRYTTSKNLSRFFARWERKGRREGKEKRKGAGGREREGMLCENSNLLSKGMKRGWQRVIIEQKDFQGRRLDTKDTNGATLYTFFSPSMPLSLAQIFSNSDSSHAQTHKFLLFVCTDRGGNVHQGGYFPFTQRIF